MFVWQSENIFMTLNIVQFILLPFFVKLFSVIRMRQDAFNYCFSGILYMVENSSPEADYLGFYSLYYYFSLFDDILNIFIPLSIHSNFFYAYNEYVLRGVHWSIIN